MRRLSRLLVYGGTAAVVLGLGKLHATYIGGYSFTGSDRFGWAIAYVVLLCLAAYGLGLPDLPTNAYAAMASATGATAAAAIGISLAQLTMGTALLPRFVVLWSAVFLVPYYALTGFVSAGARRGEVRRDRVVAVVSSDEASALVQELTRAPERRASVVWAISPDEAGLVTPDSLPLVDAVSKSLASVVVLDRAAQANESIVAQAANLHEEGTRVRTLSLFYDEWLGKLPVAELERVSLMFDIGEVHRAQYMRLKRLMDSVAAALALIALAAATPVVFLADGVGNRGPLLFRQVRVGKGGVPFTILKFRTMRPGEVSGDWTSSDDPRVTLVGRWLRRLHVDELPQAINILRGDLAVVGPRPEQPRYVDELTEKIPFYGLRHLVRPGLTGWAQVKYPYGASELDALEKLQYEFYYLRHQSLGLDLRIVGRTVRSVLGLAGR